MSGRRDAQARRVLAVALGGAFLAHAIALAVDDATHDPDARLIAVLAPFEPIEAAGLVAWDELAPVAIISLDAEQIARLPLSAVHGPGDDAAWTGAHPMPGASADLPGARAADRGGGASGGPDTWTGRRDPDQTALRAQLWNGAAVYRTPRADLGRRAATREAIARTPARAYGDRQVRRVALAGDPVASRGDRADGTGAGQGLIAAPPAAAPELEAAAGVTVPARVDGATRPTDEGALVDQGAAATDVTRHGRTGDDVAAVAASSERNPDPFDLTPSRSGGAKDGEGVRGKRNDDGALADGRGTGTAASTATAPRGKGGLSVFASRTDPYLRELLRRLDRAIRFPHDLKLDLRSGRVIASLTLHADGRISDVTIATSSGYQGFDDELTRALRTVGSLGRAPAALLDGRRAIKVMVPYTFRNPMIR